MRIERFSVDDVDRINNWGGQDMLVSAMTKESIAKTIERGNHYSLFSDDALIACFGVVPYNDWRCLGWALLRSGAPEMFVSVHQAIRRLMKEQPWIRIEAFTQAGNVLQARWTRLLGFHVETPFKPYYFPDGTAASEWVYLNPSR